MCSRFSRLPAFVTVLFSLFAVCICAAGPPLEVANAGPRGEIAKLAEANEIRIVFSEPMVVLGRIPDPVRAPYLKISPPVKGSFRWSGTKTLIFTPAAPLPYATKYEVTIDTSATSVASKRLERGERFSFVTPTVRLLRTSWYRKAGRSNSPIVLALHFNQPVRPETIAAGMRVSFESHDFTPPEMPNGVERWKTADPAGFADFEAKVERARSAAGADGPVPIHATKVWNRKWFPPVKELVVLETNAVPPAGSWLHVEAGPGLRGLQGKAPSEKKQGYTVKLEPMFFVEGFRCETACDPDSYNPLRLRSRVSVARLRRALGLTDVTDRGKSVPVPQGRKEATPSAEPEETSALYPRMPSSYEDSEQSWWASVTPEEAGFALKSARAYLARVDRTLRSADGQTLGYNWMGVLENWHQNAFTSFGSGQGVWESSGGPQLPFYARNLKTITQWLTSVKPESLLPTLLALEAKSFTTPPPVTPVPRTLAPVADKIQTYGLNLKPFLSPAGTGLIWAALQDGEPIPKAHPSGREVGSTLVQVTNLGLSVKDSPQNTLVFVTHLDNGEPVAGAKVSIVTVDNQVFWTGSTGEDGIAMAPATNLRKAEEEWKLHFLVLAEKDGDLAYVGSNWNEGVSPWMFHLNYDLSESKPILRGSVFADRGVYKLGEELHYKAVLRSDTAEGIRLLPKDTAVKLTLTDSQGAEVGKATLKLNDWSAADSTFKLPEDGALGHYTLTASVEEQRLEVRGGFLVAAYRRPDFRVDANLSGETSLAGVQLKGIVNGQYLFGAPMAARAVRWTYSRQPLYSVPRAVTERFPEERWVFLDNDWGSRERRSEETLATKESTLDAEGKLVLDLDTKRDAGAPYQYALEGEVTDVSRQSIAGRASFRVDPAPWYVGVKEPPYFADVKTGVDTEIVAADLAGKATAGVSVGVVLRQIQWNSVRRAEGKGFYTWETERKEVDAGRWDVTTTGEPMPLHIPIPRGGYYVLAARAQDAEGRSTTTKTGFYVLGPGYTAWERYDHNRIDLVPEKKTYRPGETARILVKSPWEKATALLTTEREGIRTHKRFPLTSTQQTVEVPIGEADIPNVYVSVLLLKGRSGSYTDEDASDPGKPSYRLGYVELKVEEAAKRLTVAVKADKEEYRPAAKARVEVAVRDSRGQPGASEVTLWAVDYGVLSLTAYKTPEIVESVYVAKAIQVSNEDSRQNIVSRRVIVPKGAQEGGGGGEEEGPGTPVRKDFRVLAFWLGSLATNAQGRASTEVTLPESLTTYRIMAVAGDKLSRFGRGEQEIRVSKPVLLKAAFPRFLALSDTALFGSVLHSQLKEKGSAIVTMQSLDPQILEISEDSKKVVEVGPRSSTEVRFSVKAKAVGRVRIRMTVKLLGESDAFEEVLPVEILSSPETVAAYGQANPTAEEKLELPSGIVPGFGGLHFELSSTALVGLGEGARYLVEYPYGCAEQRASTAVALLLAADLGEAFRLPDIEPGKLKEIVRTTLKDLEEFQCSGGGFAYWKGSCVSVSPYLTSYILSVYQRGERLGYDVNKSVVEKAYSYLEGVLGEAPPTNEGWWPSYTAWQAFAVKVLTEGGRNQDSQITRLYGYLDRMPVFALSYLFDALNAKGEKGERVTNLQRRMTNPILPEGGSAHVEELNDPYLLWFWNSNVRSSALVLESLVRHTTDQTFVPGLVRWLMKARRNGRWTNTQENAIAMGALVEYYRKYEKEIPDFSAVVTLGTEALLSEKFQGRSSQARTKDVSMKEVLGKGRSGERFDLRFQKQGAGVLHYVTRLRYAVDAFPQQALDQGIRVERAYTPAKAGAGTEAVTSYKAGDLVRVTLTFHLTKERRWLAVTDPLPAGVEAVESWFATTATDLAKAQQEEESQKGDWMAWWQRGGFDHVERHDDRVLLFATRLSEGAHHFSYVVRATTAGTFRVAPAHAEEMYEPEVFGRTATDVIEVKP